MNRVNREELPRGGFAGLRETRLVTDRRVFGAHAETGAWEGIGNFVYLADARFLPKGETRMHKHEEIDVISVMVEGRIAHEGSLEHGQEMNSQHVQVQRAGGEGFSHNEINPDDTENRMIQIWVLPEQAGEPAGYKLYQPDEGGLTRVYGGPPDQNETFASHTLINVGLFAPGDSAKVDGAFLAYVTRGSGHINGKTVEEGDLVRDENLVFEAATPTQLIVVNTF